MKKEWSKDRIKMYLGYAAMFLCYIIVALFSPQLAEGEGYGIWTLVPPLSIFAFILLTKKILEGFFWSSLLTVFIKYRWGFMGGFVDDMFENVTNWDNWWVIYLFLLAGAITYLFKISGAGTYFARWIAKRIKNEKVAMFVTSFILWPLCIDDYMSALVTGSVFSPLLDNYKVPREMTAYVIRSNAAPSATLLPIGAWAIYVGAVLDMWELDIVANTNGFNYYFSNVLPFLFFPMAAILVSWLTIIGIIPKFGKMKRAFKRVEEGGPVGPPKAVKYDDNGDPIEEEVEEAPEPRKKVNLTHFLVPIVAIICFGYIFEWDMAYGITWGLLVTFVYYCFTGVFNTDDAKDVVVGGFGYMSEMCIMMGLGLILCNGLDSIGFVDFVVGAVGGLVSAKTLPIIIFVVFSATEMLVTFNYTLYLIAMPIVVALAQSCGANVPMVIAALVSTGVFGYMLAFSSDGGMLTCAACGNIDIYEQNTTQYPYVMIAWVLAAAAYLVGGFML